METPELQTILNILDCGIVKLVFHSTYQRSIQWANDGFYRLTGRSPADYQDPRNAGDPRNVVHPHDYELVFNAFAEHKNAHRTMDITYRVFHKNGSIIFLHVTASYVGEENGCPAFVCAMVNVSDRVALRRHVQWERERFIAISELCDELFYEYHCATDTLHLLGWPHAMFNNKQQVNNFRQVLAESDLIYPSDRPIALAILQERYQPHLNKRISGKFRMQRGDGEYRWHQSMYSVRLDHHGSQIILGKLIDVHDSTLTLSKLTRLTRQDGLTGLLNQTAAAEVAAQRLAQRPSVNWVLMLMDIDHFKSINDSRGHAHGDAVLSTLAHLLQTVFSDTQAIIGRIGGDEFLVLYPGLPQHAVTQREIASRMTKLQQLLTDCTVSAGAVLSQQLGNTYTLLFNAADKALYQSKQQGRNRLTFYRES